MQTLQKLPTPAAHLWAQDSALSHFLKGMMTEKGALPAVSWISVENASVDRGRWFRLSTIQSDAPGCLLHQRSLLISQARRTPVCKVEIANRVGASWKRPVAVQFIRAAFYSCGGISQVQLLGTALLKTQSRDWKAKCFIKQWKSLGPIVSSHWTRCTSSHWTRCTYRYSRLAQGLARFLYHVSGHGAHPETHNRAKVSWRNFSSHLGDESSTATCFWLMCISLPDFQLRS